MRRRGIPASLRRSVAVEAGYRCGYCLTSERLTGIPLTIDHIIPAGAGGGEEERNLWLACRPCNEFKGTRTAARDPESGKTVPLFNPRAQLWGEHFVWNDVGTFISGITPVGRATVAALRMNHDLVLRARQLWVKAGWHPPEVE